MKVNSKCIYNMLSIPKYFRRKTMYQHDSQICFNNNHSGNTTLDTWRTVMQFTYGDVEPNIIFQMDLLKGAIDV